MFHEFLIPNKEVNEAIKQNRPLVALESSFLSHGLGYPENFLMAQELKHLIREKGATPAMIAIIAGKIYVGLDEKTMLNLAKTKNLIKASKRDLSFILSTKKTATTTTTAAMYCAHLAHLSVFVTGNLGGINHQVGKNADIFADIVAISEIPITFVCSGTKSILDLPKTLEMLETCGVSIIGYGTDKFPTSSNHNKTNPLLKRLNSADEIANLMIHQQQLALNKGIIIANPHVENNSFNHKEINPLIEQMQNEAKTAKKTITPHFLEKIVQLSTEKNLKLNLELIKNNANLATEIALAYQKVNKTIKT
ncbi:MAG: pseudouridine-5'-phosphate glycosidase [Proteobacteria bacterium]|nr:pseudouridine-5'-phosphate glycosidase [Pseudomonadota bacterium]